MLVTEVLPTAMVFTAVGSALKPRPVVLLCVVTTELALLPIPELLLPVVFEAKLKYPIEALLIPVVFDFNT